MYCNTLSLITATQPDWFPYMEGEKFSDQILEWMNAKYNGQKLPLKFFS